VCRRYLRLLFAKQSGTFFDKNVVVIGATGIVDSARTAGASDESIGRPSGPLAGVRVVLI
jgi:hypothetical protein